MCGRYVLDATPAQLVATFQAIDRLGVLTPTFNAAPSQLLPIVSAADGQRVLERAVWGLVPPAGAKAPPMLINARAEALGRSAAHREAFEHGRIVVPATAFYEWAPPSGDPHEHDDDPDAPATLFDLPPVEPPARRTPKGPKVPMAFQAAGQGELFALAGVARDVVDEHGQVHRTFAIVTTTPNELVEPVHDRMPAILEPDALDAWLGDDSREARAALGPLPVARMRVHAVSTLVNDTANDGPELLQPA